MILPFDAVGEGPTVVLLHAGVADRTMWREHLAPLADSGRRTIALDLPGFGEAGLEPGPQSPWEDILQTLRVLTSDPVAFVGNSYGGAVALRVAVIAPAQVSALALISAPAPGADEDPSDELAAAWEAEESALEAGDVEGAVAAVVDAWTLPDAPAELRERLAAMQRRAFLLQQATPGTGLGADPLEDRLDRLAELPMPALCTAGTRDKPDFIKGAEQMAEALPQGRHARIARAGHLAPLEQPRAFRRQLLDFLDDVSPAS
jgi:pimeloyl-ACP methyl ester carboxylesterase